jgi:hypothetical protein
VRVEAAKSELMLAATAAVPASRSTTTGACVTGSICYRKQGASSNNTLAVHATTPPPLPPYAVVNVMHVLTDESQHALVTLRRNGCAWLVTEAAAGDRTGRLLLLNDASGSQLQPGAKTVFTRPDML